MRIRFTRKSQVTEQGQLELDLPDGTPEEEVSKAIAAARFRRFVVKSREYGDLEYDYEIVRG